MPDSDPLTPHSALERQLGLSGASPMDMDGHIPESPDESPPAGRAAVSYGTSDPLFSPTAAAGSSDLLGAGLLDALSSSGADGGAAMIAQLEVMAADFERQSGVPETEIRAKIAALKSVFAARPGAVAAQRAQMDAAMGALDAEEAVQPQEQPSAASAATVARAEAAALRSLSAVSDSIEADLGRVDSMLRSDPEAAAIVGSLMSNAAQEQRRH
jgi:hypothetical protein